MSTVIEAETEVVSEVPEQKELLVVVEQNQLQADTAQSLQKSFAPAFQQARSVLEKSRQIVVTSGDQKLEIKMARACRLELKAIRVASDKLRKELKDESLRKGRAVDGFYNILLHLTETEEKRLQEQEDFVERQEAARKAALIETRSAILVAIQVDPALYQTGEMSEETFNNLVEGTKLARAQAEERRLAAEKERIEREKREAEERERIRLENERLKKEAEEREAAAKIEREKAEAERKRLEAEKAAAEEAARKEREALAAKAKAELEAAQAKARAEREAAELKAKQEREEAERQNAERIKAEQAKAQAEREAREKIEAEQRAAREAEEAKKRTEAEAAKKAEQAPDREKVLALAKAVRTFYLPKLSSEAGMALSQTIHEQFTKMAGWLEKKAEELK